MPDRKGRGSRTQAVVAEWYDRHLWPGATSGGSGRSGSDVIGVPLDIEVKARREFAPLEWVRQVRRRQPVIRDLPGHVVMRPDGLGETAVGEWLVIRALEDDTGILQELLYLRKRVKELESVSPLREMGELP